MENVDHKISRRVYGLRIVAIIFGIVCLFNIVITIISPSANVEFVNKAFTLLNLFYFLYFGYVYQYLTIKNYNFLLISTILALFVFYFVGEYLTGLDNKITQKGLGVGRSSDYFILFPLVMLISSMLFQRPSVVVMFIIFFSLMLIYKYYPVIADNKTFFTTDWKIIIEDGNAINSNHFVFVINIWIISCILC